jgi:fido (protein-threonine AMPylation protein)
MIDDPYVDHSGILLNKFGITDQPSLDVAEAGAVAKRSAILQLNPLKANFDSEHLKGIHSYLFRDVYAWAGQFRTITLANRPKLTSTILLFRANDDARGIRTLALQSRRICVAYRAHKVGHAGAREILILIEPK